VSKPAANTTRPSAGALRLSVLGVFDFCIEANAHPDETKVERRRAQRAVEEAIRRALS
jgi:hypothetical protein